MVTTELAIQMALLVVCIVAAFVLFIVALMLGMAYVGDGSDKSTASAKERWEDRLILVGAILVAVVTVGLLLVALFILWDMLHGRTPW
jgi:hypothetical protein